MSKASETAYQAIRSRILSGEFPEGAHLKEEELAEICGVSRTPIRDALRKLAADTYVRIVPNHGTFVAHWSKDDIEDIFHLRALLEGHAARRAAGRITAEQLAELEDCHRIIDRLLADPRHFDDDAFLAANRRFHSVLREAAQSPRLATLLMQLVQQPVVVRTAFSYEIEHFSRSNEHHRELIDALRAGDGNWAEAVMRSHIHAAYQVYRKAYGANARGAGEILGGEALAGE